MSRTHSAIHIFAITLLATFVWSANSCAQVWQAIPPMLHARAYSQAVVLHGGELLVAGGRDSQKELNYCEIYDPATSTWRAAAALNIARFEFKMILLNDGRVLAAGGLTNTGVGTTATTEIYDPVTDVWKVGPTMSDPREDFAACLLPNGKVVLVGGLNANLPAAVNSCDIFDPVTNTLLPLPKMPISLYACGAFFLPTINSLIVTTGQFGGTSGYFLKSTQLFNFATNSWSLADSLLTPHCNGYQHIQTPDGTVMLPSGRSDVSATTKTIEVFDPAQRKWRVLGSLSTVRVVARSLAINNDSVIVMGGLEGNDLTGNAKLSTCEWIDLRSGQTALAPQMLTARCEYPAVLSFESTERPCQPSETIYVLGGYGSDDKITDQCERLVLVGSNQSSALVSSPQNIISNRLPCFELDTSITLKNFGCDSIIIDALQTRKGLLVSAVSVVFPDTLSSGTNLTLKFKADLTPQDSIGEFVLLFHHGLVKDSIKIRIQSQSVTSNPLANSGAIQMRESICNAHDTTLKFFNTVCQSVIVDSITLTGVDASRFVISGKLPTVGFPITLVALDTLEVGISTASLTSGSFTATVHLFYHVGARAFDTSIALSWLITKGNGVVAQSLISDKTAMLGDSVLLPLYILDNTNLSVDGITFDFEYNTDLLTMIDPNLQGTLSNSGSPFDLQHTASGATLFLPGTFKTSTAMPVVNLRFRSFVTDTNCTELHIRSIRPFPNGNANCVLAVEVDSAQICFTPLCGDALLQRQMRSKGLAPIELSIDPANNELSITSDQLTSDAQLQIYDVLGFLRTTATTASRVNKMSLDVSSLRSGTYCLRITTPISTRSKLFHITR
jgi:hypothetical protein